MNRFLTTTTTSIVTFFIAASSFAFSETSLVENYKTEIIPYILSHTERSDFKGVGGKEINYFSMKTTEPKGVIIISPGQSESSLKYSELMYDMKDWGYDIFIIDHRGQGFSERLLEDREKSHVESFYDYVDDFTYFVNSVVQPEKYKKSILLSHSMGGAVASGYLVQFPKTLTKAILSTPMIEINTQFGQLGPSILAEVLDIFNFDKEYSPNQGPYDRNQKFSDNSVTSSEERFQVKQILYNDLFPQLAISGTTVKWVRSALSFTAQLRLTKNVFQIPTLMFQAGKDQWVLPGGQNSICLVNSLANCKMIHFSTAQHEILNEKDSIRDLAISKIKEFVEAD